MRKIGLAIALGLLSSAAMAQTQMQTVIRDGRPIASQCSTARVYISAGGAVVPIQWVMNNDGGWCGTLSKMIMYSRVFGAKMHVTKQPAHGEVVIVVYGNGTSITYRPNPGFVGSDTFKVENEAMKQDVPFEVMVK
jgi:hypothetical protein